MPKYWCTKIQTSSKEKLKERATTDSIVTKELLPLIKVTSQ
jgi:hypothetical protein